MDFCTGACTDQAVPIACAVTLRRAIAQVGMQHPGLGSAKSSASPGQPPGGGVLDMALAAQHQEVAALRDQMAMLRHEMTAMRQGSTRDSGMQSQQQVLRA